MVNFLFGVFLVGFYFSLIIIAVPSHELKEHLFPILATSLAALIWALKKPC